MEKGKGKQQWAVAVGSSGMEGGRGMMEDGKGKREVTVGSSGWKFGRKREDGRGKMGSKKN